MFRNKNKADGSSRRTKKNLAGRPTTPLLTKVPESLQFVVMEADAHKVFDEMPTRYDSPLFVGVFLHKCIDVDSLVFFYILGSCNDDTYMSTMGVGSNNSHWSQTNEVYEDDHFEWEVDEDGEGIVDAPKERAGNYTMDEDILLCNTWLHVSMDANIRGDQSRDAYWDRMKEHFDLHNKSGIDRMGRSLRSRWSTINKYYQRWAAALKAVDTINTSDTNDRYRVSVISLCSFHFHASFLVFQVLTCSFVCSSLLHKTYFKEKRRRPRKGRSRKEDHLCWPIATMC